MGYVAWLWLVLWAMVLGLVACLCLGLPMVLAYRACVLCACVRLARLGMRLMMID